jgi:hypothetical protein
MSMCDGQEEEEGVVPGGLATTATKERERRAPVLVKEKGAGEPPPIWHFPKPSNLALSETLQSGTFRSHHTHVLSST